MERRDNTLLHGQNTTVGVLTMLPWKPALTSIGLNSTLHPMGESGGGGLNLMLFQLVDWIFCGQRELERHEEQRSVGKRRGKGVGRKRRERAKRRVGMRGRDTETRRAGE